MEIKILNYVKMWRRRVANFHKINFHGLFVCLFVCYSSGSLGKQLIYVYNMFSPIRYFQTKYSHFTELNSLTKFLRHSEIYRQYTSWLLNIYSQSKIPKKCCKFFKSTIIYKCIMWLLIMINRIDSTFSITGTLASSSLSSSHYPSSTGSI